MRAQTFRLHAALAREHISATVGLTCTFKRVDLGRWKSDELLPRNSGNVAAKMHILLSTVLRCANAK